MGHNCQTNYSTLAWYSTNSLHLHHHPHSRWHAVIDMLSVFPLAALTLGQNLQSLTANTTRLQSRLLASIPPICLAALLGTIETIFSFAGMVAFLLYACLHHHTNEMSTISIPVPTPIYIPFPISVPVPVPVPISTPVHVSIFTCYCLVLRVQMFNIARLYGV